MIKLLYTQKHYRIPHCQKIAISEKVQRLIEDKIAEPPCSDYNNPLLLVPKKSNSNERENTRLVIDYRRVNEKLSSDKYPLSRIDDMLDKLDKAKCFCCLDLMSGFHQISLHPFQRIVVLTDLLDFHLS